jgi:pimeloyl-ACP methyl ester carboxylesterase
LGGLLGYYFAASYPAIVEKLVVLDALFFGMYPTQYQSNMLRGYGERLLKLEKEDEVTVPPSYPLHQALHKLADSRGTKMTEAGVRALASRGLEPIEGHEDLYRFSKDRRIKCFIFPVLHDKEAVHIMRQLKCQLLLVIGSKSVRIAKNSVSGDMLEAAAKSCLYFKQHIVDGDHDVHLNFPERVAPLVAKFLSEPVSSL